MKYPQLHKMSSEQLGTYHPKSQDEAKALAKERGFRQWCQEHEEDYENEETRECYKEVTGESFLSEPLVKIQNNKPLVRSFFGAKSVAYAAD
jgi:hypothetical protein